MNDAEKTNIIFNKLSKRFNVRGYAVFPELRLGSGYSDVAQRRIDLFVISSEKGNYTTAFEIKVSRQDFKKDMDNPLKQRGARLYASNFFYVTPKGMLNENEVPVYAGLMEYDFEASQFITKIPAPLQSRNTPSWGLVCSLVRNVNKQLNQDKLNEYIQTCKNQEAKINLLNRQLNQAAELFFSDDKNKQELLDLILKPYLVL